MSKATAILVTAAIISVAGALLIKKGNWMTPEAAGREEVEAAPAATAPSALPDPEIARLRRVRSAIADGSGNRGYEFRDEIVKVARSLSDEELFAALRLVEEPNYAIEDICSWEDYPLERKVALLNHFIDFQEAEGMNDAIQATAYEFVRKDVAAAREWLRKFEPGVGSGQGLSAIFAYLDETDPAAGIAMFRDLDDREAEAILGYGSGPRLGQMPSDELIAMIDSMRSEKLREFHRRHTIVWHLAEDDPEAALRYVRELSPDDRSATHGEHLVRAWTRTDDPHFPTVIERIHRDLPSGAESAETYYVVAEAWDEHSRTELLAWIGTLDAGAYRDAAIRGHARQSVFDDAEPAYRLALTMENPTARTNAIVWALRNWAKQKPEAVRAILPDVEIGDSERRSIERTIESGT